MKINKPPFRRKNLLLMLVFIIVVPFTILLIVVGPDLNGDNMAQRLAEYQLRTQYLESMYRARQEDVAVLSHYLGMVNDPSATGNTTYFSTVLDALSPDVRTVVRNITGSAALANGNQAAAAPQLHLPSVYNFLPHLLDDPNSLKAAYLLARGPPRPAVSIVLGIPTVKRDKQSYLMSTLNSLITRMSEAERNDTLIVVFIGETDQEWISLVSKQIEVRFSTFVDSGLIHVVAPPPSYYPNMDALRITLNDPVDRVKWRSKQNLDYAFLMSYSQLKGTFYVQLEDDILVKDNFITKMKDFALKKSTATNDSWFLLDFCTLGFIGKMFKSAELPWIITFLQMFYNDKPVDWLLDCLIYTKACTGDKDAKHCRAEKNKIWLHHNPSLFQHIGLQSSLKGKVQKLKDKQFGKVPIFYPHKNPPATLHSDIVPYKTHSIERAYKGDTFFWGLLPKQGDTVQILFNQPLEVKHFMFRSGNIEHPEDRFYNTSIEVLPETPLELIVAEDLSGGGSGFNTTTDGYLIVGSFDQLGVAEGSITAKVGKVKELRLRVQGEAENWVILSEIMIESELKR